MTASGAEPEATSWRPIASSRKVGETPSSREACAAKPASTSSTIGIACFTCPWNLIPSFAGERVVLVVPGQHGAEEPAVRAYDSQRAVPLDALLEHGRGDAGRYGRAAGGATDDRVRVERASRAVGQLAVEPEQLEAVAGGQQAEKLVLGHDLAVGTEARRPLDRMTMPGSRPRRELVHPHVAA